MANRSQLLVAELFVVAAIIITFYGPDRRLRHSPRDPTPTPEFVDGES